MRFCKEAAFQCEVYLPEVGPGPFAALSLCPSCAAQFPDDEERRAELTRIASGFYDEANRAH